MLLGDIESVAADGLSFDNTGTIYMYVVRTSEDVDLTVELVEADVITLANIAAIFMSDLSEITLLQRLADPGGESNADNSVPPGNTCLAVDKPPYNKAEAM